MGERRTHGRPGAQALRTPLDGAEGLDLGLIELFFFAYRDFTAGPDRILEAYDFGRAHHRVLHFVNRMPGLTVAELLDVLKITKQSLARVLKQLIDTGHVVQMPGPRDRRQRMLYPTEKGRALAVALARPQSERIRAALAAGKAEGRGAVEDFLRNMVDADWRPRLDKPRDVGPRELGARELDKAEEKAENRAENGRNDGGGD